MLLAESVHNNVNASEGSTDGKPTITSLGYLFRYVSKSENCELVEDVDVDSDVPIPFFLLASIGLPPKAIICYYAVSFTCSSSIGLSSFV